MSASKGTLRGLDILNFLLADVQMGVGPFLAIYLAAHGWNEQSVGIALTVGSLSGIVAQAPVGSLIDHLKAKRTLIAIAISVLGISSLVIAFYPSFVPIIASQVLIGSVSTIFIPAVCAISLGVVGHRAFGERQGRNQAFNSAGNVAAALLAGGLGYYFSNRSVFFGLTVACIPAMLTLLLIRPEEIDHEEARGADKCDTAPRAEGISALLRNRQLLAFLACAILFHFANAAMLPLVGQQLAKGQGRSSMMFMAACVIVTQLVITLIATTCGRQASIRGRKPLLLIGFLVLPIRGILYTLTASPLFLIAIQVLDGIGAGIFGVVSVLVVADLTQGTGKFNLVLGVITAAVGIGASLSQTIAGSIAHHFGTNSGFLFLSAVACVGLGVLQFWMPETVNVEGEKSSTVPVQCT